MSELHPRIACCVPFCRRGSRKFPPGTEIICGKHWRLVDRALKRFRTRALKRLGQLHEAAAEIEAAQAALASGGPEDAVWWAVDRRVKYGRRYRLVERATWRRMKRQAIERAGGISA